MQSTAHKTMLRQVKKHTDIQLQTYTVEVLHNVS